MTAEAAVPQLPAGVRLREDRVRGGWVVLAPERMFVPDEHAAEVLKLVDGARSIGAIADILAGRYDAARDVIIADVTAMLEDLAGKGAIRL